MTDQIEIRLLGRLWVRTADGQIVPASHWTTGKTIDLLRLLAVKSGQTVSTISLIDKLWPEVGDAKATASLRTATAQIRKALGKDSVVRHLSGLQLRGCWVDVVAHRSLAVEADAAMRARDYARVVSVVKEAEALYVDDFRAYDDESDWAREIRERLQSRRKLMLADAAESATELGWMRDAIEMSTLAISLDPCFERSHRALMRAYAGIGETESALRTYDRCRRNLLTDLGASPSAQTRALHLQLLSWEPNESQFSSFVGREDTVAELEEALRVCEKGDGTDLVVLTGSPGSGREALLQAATDRLPNAHLRAVRPPKVARKSPARKSTPHIDRTDVAMAGPLDSPPARAHATMSELLATVDPQPGRVLVLITSPEAAQLLCEDVDTDRYRPHVVNSPPIEESDLRNLAEMVLAGPPSPELLRTLEARSSGLTGAAVGILRTWVTNGQVISTVRGLDLIHEAPKSTVLSAASATFRVLAEQLEAQDMEICQVLAVIDRPASATELMEILGDDRRTEERRLALQDRMDHLTDRGILRTTGDVYSFRDRMTQDVFELWLRPSLRARITRRIDGGGLEDDRVPVNAGALPRKTQDRRAPVRGRRATDRL